VSGDFWELAHKAPSAMLRGRVLPLRGFQVCASVPRRRLDVPTGLVTLVIGFGEPLSLRRAGGQAASMRTACLVSGLTTAATIAEYTGSVRGVEVSFTPPVAWRLLRLSMAELADAWVDPVDVFGRVVAELPDRLARCSTWSARFSVVERFLAARLDDGPRCPPEIEWAWRRLRGGGVSVAQLSRATERSPRWMQRRFLEHIGHAPRDVARVARFQRALRRIDAGFPLAQAACDAGYHDQAHLDRDFKRLTGQTPSSFRSARSLVAPSMLTERIPAHVTSIVLPG
jgi:AraC-like DNA-binding protein